MTSIMFWSGLAGLIYIYAGYPCLIHLLSRWRPLQRVRRPVCEPVSVVIACHNDAERVRAKLVALLTSPQSELIREVLVGSDGSTDNIRAAVEDIADTRIRLIEFPERRGKPAVLNELIPQCGSEIVVLCDARQILSENAIPELLANFADPQTGVVSGELMFRSQDSDGTAVKGIGAYWKYEKLIRKAESRYRSVPGATGALYAIRKVLFRPIPESTLLDDVVIPMQAVAEGYRCVFESRAVAWDDPSSSLGREAVRKRRTIAGAAQMIVQHPAWLLPWRNPIWLEYVSHKVLRLLSPFLLLIVLTTNLLLMDQPLYRLLLILQACFYYSAFAGWLCQRLGVRSVLFGLQLTFLTLNATTLAALWDALRGRFQVTWRRTA